MRSHALYILSVLAATSLAPLRGGGVETTIPATEAKRMFSEALLKEKTIKTFSALKLNSGKTGTSTYLVTWRKHPDGFKESRTEPADGLASGLISIRNREGYWTLSYDLALREDFPHPAEESGDTSAFVETRIPYDVFAGAVAVKGGQEVQVITRKLSPEAYRQQKETALFKMLGEPTEDTTYIRARDQVFLANIQKSRDGGTIFAVEYRDGKVDEPLDAAVFQIPADKIVKVATNFAGVAQALTTAYTNSTDFRSLKLASSAGSPAVVRMAYSLICLLVLGALAKRYWPG